MQKGVYCPVQGPNLETVAEYRMIRKWEETRSECQLFPKKIAHNLGIEVLGLSIITDEGFPDTLKAALLPHILEAAAVAEPKLTLLIRKLVGAVDS
ncbi:MAG: hypothetical protein R3A12_07205 [Ignavibacteria bacterium]